MARVIYEVYAKIVDATGAYSTLKDYPKVFDSKSYDDDVHKTLQRAYGAFHECLGAMCKVDTRQIQLAMLIDVANGNMLEMTKMGNFPNNNGDDMG